MTGQVRSASVRLDADVASYVAKMRLAGRETDKAFANAGGHVKAMNQQLALAPERTTKATEALREHTKTATLLNNRTNKLATSTDLLNQRLEATHVTVNRLGPGFGNADARVRSFSSSVDRGTKSIDQYSGRLNLLVQGLAVAGPALSPLVAGSVPALAGLTAGLGATAGALGVTVLAVHGLGDALKAVNEAQLDPTPEKLAKARAELERLGPAGAQFVAFLDDISPKLGQLQRAARDGLFPGVESGINDLMHRLPQVKRIVSDIATTMGDLSSDAGESLAGPRWDDFFTYLDHRAGPILRDFAASAGNVGEGLANMLVALDPATEEFSDGMLAMTERFANWSAGLDENQSFQAFLSYAQEKGPQVIDLLGSLVDTLVSIGTAAAPVGDVVLPALTSLLNILSAIAKSDLGTPIITAMAALSAARLLMKAVGIEAQGSALKFVAAEGTKRAAVMKTVTALREAARLNAASGVPLRQTLGRQGALMPLARGAGMAAGIGLLATGAADGLGLSNTVSLGLAGSMIAPGIGTALGTIAGLTLDIIHSNDKWEESMRRVNSAYGTTIDSLSQKLADIGSLQSQATTQLSHETGGLGQLGYVAHHPVDALSTGVGIVQSFFGGTTRGEEEAAAAAKKQAEFDSILQSLGQMQLRLGGDSPFQALGSQASVAVPPMERLDGIIARVTPALEALGLQWDDLKNTDSSAQVFDWIRESDASAGSVEGVGNAFRALTGDLTSTVDAASNLQTALDELLSPTLDQEAATDAWRQSLTELADKLNDKAGFEGQTEAARQNRAMTRDYVSDVETRLTAMAKNNAGEMQMAKAVRASRKEFIDAGVAAGIDADVMAKRANAIGLTPKLVQTVFKNLGISKADLEVSRLRKSLDGVPPRVVADIDTNGVPETNAEIDALVKKYHLTEKQRTALITLKDEAAKSGAEALNRFLDNVVHKRTAVVTIQTVNETVRGRGVSTAGNRRGGAQEVTQADGGQVFGPGGPRDDLIPAWLSNREFVMPVAAVDHYGVGFMERVRAQKFAGGGLAMHGGNGGTMAPMPSWSPAAGMSSIGTAVSKFVAQMTGSTKDLKASLRDVGHALKENQRELEAETKARDKAKQAVEQTRNLMASYQQQVQSNFAVDPFADIGQSTLNLGQTPDGKDWATVLPPSVLAAHQAAMEANERQAIVSSLSTGLDNLELFEELKKELRGRGVRGQALLQIDSLAKAQAAMALSDSDLRRYQRLFNELAGQLKGAGRADATAVYGAKLDRQTAELRAVRAEMRSTKEEIRALMGTQRELEREADKSRQRAAKTTAEGVGREVRAIGSRAKSAAGR